jgi:hypothetical protein
MVCDTYVHTPDIHTYVRRTHARPDNNVASSPASQGGRRKCVLTNKGYNEDRCPVTWHVYFRSYRISEHRVAEEADYCKHRVEIFSDVFYRRLEGIAMYEVRESQCYGLMTMSKA